MFTYLLGETLDAIFQSLADKFKTKPDCDNDVMLVIDKPNSDRFVFRLGKINQQFCWQRKICYKQQEMPQLSNPVDTLKYMREKLMPDSVEQEGITQSDEAAKIFALASSLASRILESGNQNGEKKLAGSLTQYVLKIRLDGVVTEMQWETTSADRQEAELIANRMIDLNNTIY